MFRYIIPLIWWLCSQPAMLISEIISDGRTPHFSINYMNFLVATLMLALALVSLAHFLDPKARRNIRILAHTTWLLADDRWTRSKWSQLQAANPTPAVLKYCPNCSLGLPAKAKYCTECGHDQSQPTPPPPYTVVYTDLRNEN